MRVYLLTILLRVEVLESLLSDVGSKDASGELLGEPVDIGDGEAGAGVPYLVELAPHGGPGERMFRVQPSVTEVGGEVGPGGVTLPGLLPRHCLIHHTEGAVTVTPCAHAEVSYILL